MYTVVLMAALSGSADATEFGHHRGASCCGCCGGGYAYGCGGCYGGGCYGGGCYGDGWGTRYYSGCYGAGCNGCYGYGCYGNSCYGSSSYSGCCGGYGAGIYYMAPQQGGYMPPRQGETIPSPQKKTPPPPGSESQARAKLTIEVPADAKLFIDNQPTAPTSGVRNFVTPPLQAGYSYAFTLRAEVMRDGQLMRMVKNISFRPGEQIRVEFPESDMVAAADR